MRNTPCTGASPRAKSCSSVAFDDLSRFRTREEFAYCSWDLVLEDPPEDTHFEPKAMRRIKMGKVSLPFSVRPHRTTIGELRVSMRSIIPSSSSSFNRIGRTLGVRPGIDSRSLLNRSIFRNPISRSISPVHFFPRLQGRRSEWDIERTLRLDATPPTRKRHVLLLT